MSERRGTVVSLAALLAVAVFVAPVWAFPLLAVPFALLLLGQRTGEPFGVAVALMLLALVFVPGAGPGDSGGWHFVRGWCLLAGGLFLALSSAGRPAGLLDRSLATVGIAAAAVAVLALARPAFGAAMDGWMAGQIREAAAASRELNEALKAVFGVGPAGEGTSSAATGLAIEAWLVRFELAIYPARFGLATTAALSLGWYFARRGGAGRPEDRPPLVREFAFRDELIWVLIGGLALLVLPLGTAAFRIGENATVFMGTLYLARGAAILGWMAAASVTSAWSWIVIGIGAVLAFPIVASTALMLGIGDTWLHVRERLRAVGMNGSGR